MKTCYDLCRLQHPNKAANPLEADHQQKVTMKFQLRDRSSGKVMTAHQTFIRLTNLETQQEIIFVSEPDASDTYKFDLVSSWVAASYITLVTLRHISRNSSCITVVIPEGLIRLPSCKHVFLFSNNRPKW